MYGVSGARFAWRKRGRVLTRVEQCLGSRKNMPFAPCDSVSRAKGAESAGQSTSESDHSSVAMRSRNVPQGRGVLNLQAVISRRCQLMTIWAEGDRVAKATLRFRFSISCPVSVSNSYHGPLPPGVISDHECKNRFDTEGDWPRFESPCFPMSGIP
jgi:hypothetical protein